MQTKTRELINKLNDTGAIHRALQDVSHDTKKTPVYVIDIRELVDKKGNDMAFITIDDVEREAVEVPLFGSYWLHIRDKVLSIGDDLVLLNLYRDNYDKIKFGTSGWETNKDVWESFVKVINNHSRLDIQPF